MSRKNKKQLRHAEHEYRLSLERAAEERRLKREANREKKRKREEDQDMTTTEQTNEQVFKFTVDQSRLIHALSRLQTTRWKLFQRNQSQRNRKFKLSRMFISTTLRLQSVNCYRCRNFANNVKTSWLNRCWSCCPIEVESGQVI